MLAEGQSWQDFFETGFSGGGWGYDEYGTDLGTFFANVLFGTVWLFSVPVLTLSLPFTMWHNAVKEAEWMELSMQGNPLPYDMYSSPKQMKNRKNRDLLMMIIRSRIATARANPPAYHDPYWKMGKPSGYKDLMPGMPGFKAPGTPPFLKRIREPKDPGGERNAVMRGRGFYKVIFIKNNAPGNQFKTVSRTGSGRTHYPPIR